MTHTITGEKIEWDAPDLYRFDPYWFVDWLAWFLNQNVFFRSPEEVEAASIISTVISEQTDKAFRERIFDVLDQLHQEGRLLCFPDRTNKHKIIV